MKEDLKGLREEIKPGYGISTSQSLTDIKAINE